MSLSLLQVFSEYAYSTFTEMLDYNLDLFNTATNGGIILQGTAHQGDYSDTAMWARISNLVRRRNAYGTGTVAEKNLQHILDTSVKVAAGTAPVRIDPSMMLWIQRSPEEAAAVVGKQMAQQAIADMLDSAIRCFRAGHEAQASNYHDGGANNGTLSLLNTARAKLGDRAGELACWVLHSKMMFDIYGTALTNSNMLFSFGTVKVTHDGFGNPFVVSDSPLLTVSGSPATYRALGLLPGAVVIGRNNDFVQNVSTVNGDENIKRTYQAEWSYNVGIQGFQWDKTSGGKSPNDTALGTAANWDKYVTSHKDLGGVVLKTN
jgi:hypothetical protein